MVSQAQLEQKDHTAQIKSRVVGGWNGRKRLPVIYRLPCSGSAVCSGVQEKHSDSFARDGEGWGLGVARSIPYLESHCTLK